VTTTGVRERRHERTRADILDAAWQLAERDGIAGLSLREVAATVGMRAPSLYTYFPSKGAIYDAMFAQGYRDLDAELAAVPLDLDDPAGSLTAALTVFHDFCLASVPRYQLLFTRSVPGWSPSPEAYAVSLASYRWMEQRLEALGVRGEDDLDLLTALSSGLAAQQLANDPGGDRWRRLIPTVATWLLSPTRSLPDGDRHRP
jgi:AcrR family transcriptional regulator